MARIFVVRRSGVPRPGPSAPVEEVRQQLSEFFPELANADTREERRGDDARYIFTRRIGTKGRRRRPATSSPSCAASPRSGSASSSSRRSCWTPGASWTSTRPRAGSRRSTWRSPRRRRTRRQRSRRARRSGDCRRGDRQPDGPRAGAATDAGGRRRPSPPFWTATRVTSRSARSCAQSSPTRRRRSWERREPGGSRESARVWAFCTAWSPRTSRSTSATSTTRWPAASRSSGTPGASTASTSSTCGRGSCCSSRSAPSPTRPATTAGSRCWPPPRRTCRRRSWASIPPAGLTPAELHAAARRHALRRGGRLRRLAVGRDGHRLPRLRRRGRGRVEWTRENVAGAGAAVAAARGTSWTRIAELTRWLEADPAGAASRGCSTPRSAATRT